VTTAFGLVDQELVLVPVPSSNVDRHHFRTSRWPALALASALESLGLGEMRVCAVNRIRTDPEHTSTGRRTVAHQLAANLDVIDVPSRGRAFVYVDDVLRRGWHLAALDHALGQPAACATLVVGVAEGGATVDAYTPQMRDIVYDASVSPWNVVVRRRSASSPPPRI
jgi:predicted amidophosphoribosyltransferase